MAVFFCCGLGSVIGGRGNVQKLPVLPVPFVDRGEGREEELWNVGWLAIGIVGELYVATPALEGGFVTTVALSNAVSNKNLAQALQQGLETQMKRSMQDPRNKTKRSAFPPFA